jgi:hypothetical protein
MTALIPSRRGFITGLVSIMAAPAIVRAGSLMPVKAMIAPVRLTVDGWEIYGRSPMVEALRELIKYNPEYPKIMGVPPDWLRP